MAEEKTDNLVQNKASDGVPAVAEARLQIRQAAAALAKDRTLIAPLPLEKLKTLGGEILRQLGLSGDYLPFTVVTLSNELWRPVVAKIPFNRRLLLLPQCLKNSQNCTAEIDSLGLLCRHCGRCSIDRFTRRAQQLGYAVLVAEGSPVVMALIESGQVQATIGVSCLSVLEKVFPYMEAGAVPGLAIPLLADGCKDTCFDEEWLLQAIEYYVPQATDIIDLKELRQVVRSWFEPEPLKRFLGEPGSEVAELSLKALGFEGKRYRPVLTAGMYATLTQTAPAAIPQAVQQAAAAVECFHKASLIHDDIEDSDVTRYDQPTLHQQHGISIALNAGDYLVGAGYRLLAQLDCTESQKVQILRTAAYCHQLLCIGQGEELSAIARKQTLSVEKVLEIFSQKTSPAFEAALKIGAILAGAPQKMLEVLGQFSAAIGIAYQIRDDIRDGCAGKPDEPMSILTSLKCFRPSEPALDQARSLLSFYQDRAIEALEGIGQSECKAFLRKVVTRLFDQKDTMECCDEYLSKPD